MIFRTREKAGRKDRRLEGDVQLAAMWALEIGLNCRLQVNLGLDGPGIPLRRAVPLVSFAGPLTAASNRLGVRPGSRFLLFLSKILT